jgi:poly-gamma-glutamate capsule biosynthesis protein CapA/YwtB (metallophosphatase superfamily)
MDLNFTIKITIITLSLIISGCDNLFSSQKNVTPLQTENTSIPTPEITPYKKEAQVIAVGDIMMHLAQTKSGYNPQTNSYTFPTFFREVQPILSQGDWVIANLETPLAGAEAKYTDYPLFNAPDNIADDMKNAGFNIISTANNHSLDRGEIGVLNTLKNLQKRDLITLGTYNSAEDKNKVLIVEKNKIKMALFSYTYGTNGIPLPQGKDYLVSLINEQKMIEDIKKAQAENVDIITIILHQGSEYQRLPNDEQKNLVKNLVNQGADLILGSHPHVVQPYEIFEIKEENGKIRKAVAIYSMGNFIAYQIGNYKDLGVIFKVKFKKSFPSEEIEITEVEAIPTYIQNYYLNNRLNFRVLPIAEKLKNQNDPLISSQQYSLLQNYLKDMNNHLNSMSK